MRLRSDRPIVSVDKALANLKSAFTSTKQALGDLEDLVRNHYISAVDLGRIVEQLLLLKDDQLVSAIPLFNLLLENSLTPPAALGKIFDPFIGWLKNYPSLDAFKLFESGADHCTVKMFLTQIAENSRVLQEDLVRVIEPLSMYCRSMGIKYSKGLYNNTGTSVVLAAIARNPKTPRQEQARIINLLLASLNDENPNVRADVARALFEGKTLPDFSAAALELILSHLLAWFEHSDCHYTEISLAAVVQSQQVSQEQLKRIIDFLREVFSKNQGAIQNTRALRVLVVAVKNPHIQPEDLNIIIHFFLDQLARPNPERRKYAINNLVVILVHNLEISKKDMVFIIDKLAECLEDTIPIVRSAARYALVELAENSTTLSAELIRTANLFALIGVHYQNGELFKVSLPVFANRQTQDRAEADDRAASAVFLPLLMKAVKSQAILREDLEPIIRFLLGQFSHNELNIRENALTILAGLVQKRNALEIVLEPMIDPLMLCLSGSQIECHRAVEILTAIAQHPSTSPEKTEAIVKRLVNRLANGNQFTLDAAENALVCLGQHSQTSGLVQDELIYMLKSKDWRTPIAVRVWVRFAATVPELIDEEDYNDYEALIFENVATSVRKVRQLLYFAKGSVIRQKALLDYYFSDLPAVTSKELIELVSLVVLLYQQALQESGNYRELLCKQIVDKLVPMVSNERDREKFCAATMLFALCHLLTIEQRENLPESVKSLIEASQEITAKAQIKKAREQIFKGLDIRITQEQQALFEVHTVFAEMRNPAATEFGLQLETLVADYVGAGSYAMTQSQMATLIAVDSFATLRCCFEFSLTAIKNRIGLFAAENCPEGVGQMRKVLQNAHLTPAEQLAEIREIAKQRLEKPSLFSRRSQKTAKLYRNIVFRGV